MHKGILWARTGVRKAYSPIIQPSNGWQIPVSPSLCQITYHFPCKVEPFDFSGTSKFFWLHLEFEVSVPPLLIQKIFCLSRGISMTLYQCGVKRDQCFHTSLWIFYIVRISTSIYCYANLCRYNIVTLLLFHLCLHPTLWGLWGRIFTFSFVQGLIKYS